MGARFAVRLTQQLLGALVTGALLMACGSSATSTQPSAQGQQSAAGQTAPPNEWTQVVEAAQKEGQLNLYSALAGGTTSVLDVFKQAYPAIKVQEVSVPNTDLVSRLQAERAAGRYLGDILQGPGTTGIFALKPSGGLAPVLPQLVLPEVKDQSVWLDHKMHFSDSSEPYTNVAFIGYLLPAISYNTKLVDGKAFTSYWDIMDPKYKGLIEARDIRVQGPNGGAPFIYTNPQLGAKWFEQLFGTMSPTLSTDGRQLIDWMAQGRFPVGFAVNDRELRDGAAQGLPVALVAPDQLKEGAGVSNGGGSIAVLDKAPHPNAAKVYLNWLLSRQGALAYQQGTGTPSMRIDIPKDGIDPTIVPDPNKTYEFIGTEAMTRIQTTEITAVINKALGQAGR